MTGILVKIATSVGLWLMVQRTREAYEDPAGPHLSFMGPLVTVMLVHEIAGNLVFISMMAFFSRVSDPSIGGSYMTLLNTIANLGSKWTTSACLFLLPRVTFHACTVDAAEGFQREILAISCTPTDATMCTEHGGKCTVDMVRCVGLSDASIQLSLIFPIPFRHPARSLGRIYGASWGCGMYRYCVGHALPQPS